MLLVIVDAVNLRTHLHTILQMRSLGLPMIVSLNMYDLASRDGLEIDIAKLEARLGVPVVISRATRKSGRKNLLARIDTELALEKSPGKPTEPNLDLKILQQDARAIARDVIISEPVMNRATRAIDKWVLHPIAGPLILIAILFFMFQAVFAWAILPMDLVEAGISALGNTVSALIPAGWLHDLIIDGIIAGVGSVLVFLPQILILFCIHSGIGSFWLYGPCRVLDGRIDGAYRAQRPGAHSTSFELCLRHSRHHVGADN